MSGEEHPGGDEADDLVHGLAEAQVKRYWAATRKPECVACESNTWTFITNVKDDHVPHIGAFRRTPRGISALESVYLPVALAICNNCADVRFLAEVAVKRWLENNPAEEDA
jgi:hypothetical protein